MNVTTKRGPAAAARRWVRGQGWMLGSVTGTTGASVVITLDDGPDEVETPKVLEVLARHEATATFFVLVGRARRHPHLLTRIRDAGHEIALHGPDHRPLTTFGFTEARRRTRAARAELEQLAGVPVRWFRPPYGSQTPVTWAATRSAGLVPVLWDSTTWDWKNVTQSERLDKAIEGARPGALLLAHDGIAGADDGVTDAPPPLLERAALLDQVLDEHRRRGLRGRSLGSALQDGALVRSIVFTGIRQNGQVEQMASDMIGKRR
ncbi:polysaccharide deacetylase family protein [Terrabacter sp. Ter38]|uniref:polysaccharide deacetylase family protein n=1 Tax=Terrabacter sp. Ter38 TaxID=2926030 RepID=UPI0021185957|nr:polysaccharide deacetylase family protein [Terrabacter sp. Ter38]